MQKEFFIGIDSDGTAFDSMTIKHSRAFIPVMIKVWGFEDNADDIYRICEDINLYSSTRGIDRFSGLLVTFDRIAGEGIKVVDYSSLKGFLESGKSLSNASLKEYMEENPSDFLADVYRWSSEADELFKKEVYELMPFKNVRRVLEKALPKADIAVISSASESSLTDDWKKDGLNECVSKVYGQEFGNKAEQLKNAACGKYESTKMIMIGDAKGDYKAAKSSLAWFYPIIPGKEDESWQTLLEKDLDLFLEGKFDEKRQQELINEFCKALKMEGLD